MPRNRAARAATTVAAALAVVVVGSGCRAHTVRIAYTPEVGDRTAYDLRVETSTVLSLSDREPVRRASQARVRATQTVLDVDPSGARVEVRVARAGSPARTFVARLDRAAHVRSIESVEGLPASVLGDVFGNLALSELVPAAASVVPAASLRPGESWAIDVPLSLPGSSPSRLRGTGRLVELGVVDGRDVGVVRSATRVAVERATALPEGRISMEGVQRTRSVVRHALDDGSVVSASSTTRASFDVTALPPEGTPASPVDGRLLVVVRSTVTGLEQPSL